MYVTMEQLEKDRKIFGAMLVITSWMLVILGILFLLAFLSPPVSAFTTTTITANDVSQYSMVASQDHYIYEIMVDSLPVGTNQTHVLNFNGATFLLKIDTIHSWGVDNDFIVSMTYPNGTIETVHAGQTSVFQTYKTKIQPVYMQVQGITLLQIDLAIGTNPTKVTFSDLEGFSQDIKTAIPFTSVSGEFSGKTSTVYAYECSIADFTNDILTGNLLPNFTNLGSGFFSWTWSTVLIFINMIPIIGPQLITMMTFVTDTGWEIIFWLNYIATNMMLVLAGGEILLLVFAFLLAGKRPTPEKFVKNFINYNVRSVTGFLWVGGLLYDWLRSFVHMVAQLVQALKPI